MIARAGEAFAHNKRYGTCIQAAKMDAWLGIVNAYPTYVSTIAGPGWNNITKRTERIGHAIAQLYDGKSWHTLTWGGTRYRDVHEVARGLGWVHWYKAMGYTHNRVWGEQYVHWGEGRHDDIIEPNWGDDDE
jgi:hypothetical protein